jgi:hypothetical protein
MSYDWNNIVFIFKNYLNPLIIDYFFSRNSVNILNCLESLYYHSTWRFTKYRWSLTSKDRGREKTKAAKEGRIKLKGWNFGGLSFDVFHK